MSKRKDTPSTAPRTGSGSGRKEAELSPAELERVTGGKGTITEIKFTKPIDKSTP